MLMSQRRVGASGLLVSSTGLGCNNFGRAGTATESLEGTRAVIDAAISNGITLLDTADMYGATAGASETLMGEALAGRRDRVVLATKFGHERDMGYAFPAARGSRRYVRRAVEESLRRLQTDWIDLYQLHLPDAGTPIAETIDALDGLVAEGKIRYYGHSNFSGWQVAEAEFVSRERHTGRFVSAQNHYSLLARAAEREVLPAVERYGLGFFPYFPLHNGLLTGKFTREGGPASSRIMSARRHVWENAQWDAIDAFRDFCSERGITMLQAAFGWLLANPVVSSVIAGATSVEQIEANAEAGEAWRPDADELALIDDLFPLPDDPGARV
ncbi:aryl-alcohol dehydrogenase-like predicted oxidoreductase [Microbacterium phyllosphaerae]|uniref:Aryl-alcohol dehydrogenase-like predicted oxidoreductase n=1 Tax=Microbacterium phyllosphaerae TaxID=124798 RepID=A0ABS4WSF0_9MICO|nr:aldo/keto reductase [Microbacterium phyllosphaerae]MBP2378429.1 aryl-alcohol dehydrogenase-like predicted oxidoreductase [Microbacterium phyllosphaerae]